MEWELGKETEVSSLLQNSGAGPAPGSILSPKETDPGEKLPALPSAKYPDETKDPGTMEPLTQTLVGSSPRKLDFGPVTLSKPESTCFSWIPADPVVEQSASVWALGWDAVE